ncbi:MAG: large-conductance mechanosensitive channel protein MscL [Candidatus Woesearchaeota archaeon]
MALLKEFKEFAMRGNVVDMAIGIIIGGAFGKIISSLVNDIIMPPIGLLVGGVDFKELSFVLKPASETTAEVAIRYGAFINVVIDFLIVAFAIFMVVKGMNSLKKKQEKETKKEEPKTKECPYCLSQIPIKAVKCAFCGSDLKK